MPTEAKQPQEPTPEPRQSPPRGERPLTPEAERALAEAAARRSQVRAKIATAKEVGGRGGIDPVRFGDWEINGLASDF